jgi:hypothetical protein
MNFEEKNKNLPSQEVAISPLEVNRIKEAINRSDTEKFLLFTRMMRIHFMLKNAIITKKG